MKRKDVSELFVMIGITVILVLGGHRLWGDHEQTYYPDARLISVERDGKIINTLECQRIPLNYPGLVDRCDVNMGRDSHGTIWAAITGTPTNTMEQLFSSKDGGRTWTSITMSPTLTYEFVAFTVLKNDTLLLAIRPEKNTIKMYLSADEGKTWQESTSLTANPYPYIGEGFLSLTQKSDGKILFPVCRYNENPYIDGVHGFIYSSTDGAASFPNVRTSGEYWLESHILELKAGKLLLVTRYQRTRLDSDTDASILALGGNISPTHDFTFKHLFLADSEDGGNTWKNFRPVKDKQNHFLIAYGQCHGQLIQLNDGRVVLLHDNRYEPEQRDVRARVSLDNGQTWESETYYISFGRGDPASVVLDDDTIVTVTGNWRYSPTGPVGNPTAQVIRWKLPSATTPPTIKIISPGATSSWSPGSRQTLRWSFTGTIPTVKIELLKGSTTTVITASTSNTSSYNWSLPSTLQAGTTYKIRVSSCDNPAVYGDSALFTIGQAALLVSPGKMVFGSIGEGSTTPAQELFIRNTGAGTLNWTLSKTADWLSCSPTSGLNQAIVSVAVNPAGLAVGTYTTSLTIAAAGATGAPVTIPITLNIYSPGSAGQPFGSFDTPLPNITVEGSVPFTGWALDAVGIKTVKIYREEAQALVYIGDAVFVQGARPDVELAYPGYPQNTKAGWGYMMLTNFLPAGNGTFTFHAIATNWQGESITLATRTINVDNAHATFPFGTLDTPTQGGVAAGKAFYNFGWALTPQPKKIATSGQTINVYVDGVNLGHPVYNQYRADIAELFPNYANSNGAVGYFKLDTTTLTNGVHTIEWSVKDDGNITGGIGSRYFSVQNTTATDTAQAGGAFSLSQDEMKRLPRATGSGIKIKQGVQGSLPTTPFTALTIQELQRIEIKLSETAQVKAGFLVIGNILASLPVGATIKGNTFYWLPGPGFLGNYTFCFLLRAQNGQLFRQELVITINPLASKKKN